MVSTKTLLLKHYYRRQGLRGLGHLDTTKNYLAIPKKDSAGSKPTTEFAQPRLSRVKARSSPARGYKFECVCSYMAGHYPGILMTSHIGTNTLKFAPPRWGRPRFDPTQISSKTRGRERKGPPEIIKEQSTILALFGRRILGQYPAAPSSPGPFGLLLIKRGCANSVVGLERAELRRTRPNVAVLFSAPIVKDGC